MVVGVGTDIASVERIKKMERSAIERILTPKEIEYCFRFNPPHERIAGRFAAKEAILKALGTGWSQGLAWRQIEILPDEQGAPLVRLTDTAQKRMHEIGATSCLLSISHEREFAVAFALFQ